MPVAIRLPITIAIPEQDVTIPSMLFPLLGMTRAGSTASKADAIRLTPDMKRITHRTRGFPLRNSKPSFAISSMFFSPVESTGISGRKIKNSRLRKAIPKVVRSTIITASRPRFPYTADAISGFPMDIRERESDCSPLVL